MVGTDRTSKYTIAHATKSDDAKTVTKFLSNFVTTFACPKLITSDRGTHFKNKEVHDFCKALGIEIRHSTSYAPQSQGGVERLNQMLCRSLSHYVQDNPGHWAKYLPYVVLDYNTTPLTDFRGLSPYYIVFGQNPLMPVNLKLGELEDPSEDQLERLKKIQKIRKEIPGIIAKNQEKL